MRGHQIAKVCLSAIFILATSQICASQEINSIYGPLPVFELHSGFWVNLHHTLYYQARLRAVPATTAEERARTNGPALRTAPGVKAALTPDEQHAWDNAVNFYATNYASKDLQFSSELVLLKNQLGEIDACDAWSAKKRASSR